jgi:hypothetical protein
MKFNRNIFVFVFISALLMSIAVSVQAGILGTVVKSTTGWLLENAIGTIMTMIFMIIAAFWGGTSWGKAILKAKAPINELDDVIVKVYNAKKSTSPGGKAITADEWKGIMDEVQDVCEKTVEAFGKTPATKQV